GPLDRSVTAGVLVQTAENNIYMDGSRDNQLYFGIRQYAECLKLFTGQVDEVLRDSDALSYRNSAIRNGYAYFVADKTEAIRRAAMEIGYEPFFETEHYQVLKSNASVTFWIIRHAKTEANEAGLLSGSESDYPLTAGGIESAVATGKALQGLKLESVHCSEADRTSRTATLIMSGMGITGYDEDEAAALGNAIEPDPGIYREYSLNDLSWGEASGKTLEEAMSIYKIADANSIFGSIEDEDYISPIPGAESRSRLFDRLNTAMTAFVTDEAAAGRTDGNVMVVGHSSMADWISRVIPEAGGIELPNTGVTVLRFSEGRWSLLAGPMTDPEEIRDAVERYGAL
ncbi:MAG: histidine phosphatase family protein, partial [Lachnospiraceae bacterium]|nr:histidine phosphatase family protein [Lachnospiraceae bacterium]